MITPINIILIIAWGILLPFLLGFTVKLILNEGKEVSIGENIAYGFVVMCVVFQLLAVPMIFLHVKYHVLKYIWITAVLTLALASVMLYLKKNGKIIYNITGFLREIKNDRFALCIWVVAVLIIAFETYLLTAKMHMDTDDSRFLADALEAVNQDTMLLTHPITGKFYNVAVGEQMKDITSPYPIFLGLIGELFGIHPTISAHTILPLLYIPLCYVVFFLVGKCFFGTKAKDTGLFVLFLSLIQLFSFETVYSAGYTLLTIIWQGRSVAAMITLPLLWYVLMKLTVKEELTIREYIVILIVTTGAAMLSNMGSLFSLIMVFAYSIINAVSRKSAKYFVFMCMSCIPAAVYLATEKILMHTLILYK